MIYQLILRLKNPVKIAKANPNLIFMDLDSLYILKMDVLKDIIAGTMYGENFEVTVQNKPGLGVDKLI